MAFIEWLDHYQTGLKNYDAQHQTLFRLANRIHECLLNNQGHGTNIEIAAVFESFVEMTRTHVYTEDELMVWQKYSPSKEHEEAHQRFINCLEETAAFNQENVDLGNRLMDILLKFKTHFEDEDEQAFLTLLRGKFSITEGRKRPQLFRLGSPLDSF